MANSHIISILGGKGGVGKTIVASNLACAFQANGQKRVLLIDMDSQSCNDQNVILGVKSPRTLADLINFSGKLDTQALQSFLTVHPSGLFFIPAAISKMEYKSMNPEKLDAMLKLLLKVFSVIIIDCGSEVNNPIVTVFENTTMDTDALWAYRTWWYCGIIQII